MTVQGVKNQVFKLSTPVNENDQMDLIQSSWTETRWLSRASRTWSNQASGMKMNTTRWPTSKSLGDLIERITVHQIQLPLQTVQGFKKQLGQFHWDGETRSLVVFRIETQVQVVQ